MLKVRLDVRLELWVRRMHWEAIIELNHRALGSEPGFWGLGLFFTVFVHGSGFLRLLTMGLGFYSAWLSEPLPQAWVTWGPKYVLD